MSAWHSLADLALREQNDVSFAFATGLVTASARMRGNLSTFTPSGKSFVTQICFKTAIY